MIIPIADIAVINRIRKHVDPSKLAEMAQMLKEDGQIQSIVVRQPRETDRPEDVKGKPWVLVAGGRRIGGAILADWTEIRAEDLGDMTPYKAMRIELMENLGREEMHFADVAETKLRLHELFMIENPEQEIQQTAAAIGESVANVSRDIALAKAIRANPELRKAGSKKAAHTAVKMEEYGRARVLEMATRADGSQDAERHSFFDTRLVTADAKDWLRTVPKASVDLLLSDVPYGIDYFDLPVGADLSEYDDSAGTTAETLEKCLPEMVRIVQSSGWIVLFTGWEGYFFCREQLSRVCTTHFASFGTTDKYCESTLSGKKMEPCGRLQMPAKPWIWYRPNSRNNSMHPDLHAQNQYEPILVVNRGAGKIVSDERIGNVLVHDAVYTDRIHEMQKPVPLASDIISRLVLRGSLVCDPFFGSGALLAGAAEEACDFKGCDSNPNILGPAKGLVSLHYKG